MNKKDLWIGIGIGAAVGITGGYIAGTQIQKRKDRKNAKNERRTAYIKGLEDAEAEAKKVIDDLRENMVVIEQTDDEATINQKIKDYFNGQEPASEPQESTEGGKTEEKEAAEPGEETEKPPASAVNNTESKKPAKDDLYAEKNPPGVMNYPFTVSGDRAIFYGAAGTELPYPKYLVMDKRGELLSASEIRANMRSYEPDIRKLSVIWNTMGWGTYIPEYHDYEPEKNAWDENLNIDDEDLEYGDEPRIKTEERARYQDELDRYIAHPEDAPRIVSHEDFYNENYLDHVYINYYDVDNVFVENDDISKEIDAFTLLGVTDGKELFDRKPITDDDNDPDIVYVKNMAHSCVMEVTRFHHSYKSIKDGSAFVHGGSGIS